MVMRKELMVGISLLAGIIIGIALLGGVHSHITAGETLITVQQENVSDNPTYSVLGKVSNNIVLDTPIPNPEEKVLVYQVIPSHYTRQDSISLAQKFNISTTGKIKEVEEGSSIASEDGTKYVILHNSGSIEFTNSNRAHTVNPFDVPGNLPTDDEAIRIATQFLTDRDLLPDDAICIGTEHGKIYQLGNNGNNTVVWEDIEVWYGRMLNGLKVKGSQLSVAVGGGGDIIDYYSNWRNYEPYKEFPVKSPEQAFDELKTKGIPVDTNTSDKVSIKEVYLAYHTKAGAETEYYLEPVWVFEGDVIVDGKSSMTVTEHIPALTDDAVKSLSS
ncbi:MAG: hypothetical protein A4E35_02147 [Methanoregula sp. PtaU1.Bin051]|nr:MAG: hypothetical protein A4E35_02147 [Methanoregula sp. PtaU1.Bin051]